jgi:alpha-ketoglutarate-dependent taurine dioxygenase
MFARQPVKLQSGNTDLPGIIYASGEIDLRNALARHGALLLRDFNLKTIDDFEIVARAISPRLIEYGERSSPRTRISSGIYTSTDHPPDQPIVLHNEQSYTLNWPMKIWFYCAQPAETGGRTPLADSRKILKRLPPDIVDRFEQKQIMYVRNYNPGIGLSWREAFQTGNRAEVEQYCAQEGIDVEWRDNDRLRTRQVRPAVRSHPETGERIWFNHAMFFNLSSLAPAARETMLAVVDESEVPFNTFYGDGSPIEPTVMDQIRNAYDSETVKFDWQRHDLLLVDNMLVAHGREPFTGDRKVLVAMAEPYKEHGREHNREL